MSGRVACGSLALILTAMVPGCDTPQGPGPGGAAPAASTTPVRFVGFDANPQLVEAVRQGKIQGLVLQDPYNMGYLGVRTILTHLEKGEVKPSIGTGAKVATFENLKDPEIAALLQPPKTAEGPDSGDSADKDKTRRLLVVPKATSNVYWDLVHAGALEAAEEWGNVQIVWQGPEKEDDYTKQIELIEGAKALGVDGIVLAPLDSKAMASPVEQAVEQGIPVVIIDSGLESKRIVSFVATDNYHGGVLAALRMANLLVGKGNIIVLRHLVGSQSTEEREKGFLETIQRYPGIKILSQDQYAGATVDTAQKAAKELITRYGGQVQGIFCSNEQSTLGMLEALEAAGMLKASSPAPG